jgi:hypothetical protein
VPVIYCLPCSGIIHCMLRDGPAAEKEARELELSAPTYNDYARKLEAMLNEARGSVPALLALPNQARALDAELDGRLAELEMTGFHEMELEDGRVFRVPAFFEAMIASLKR